MCARLSFQRLGKRRQGFTLVEILVVLAIIGILAVLLFPAFSSVRRNAGLTSCASNLHQITVALHLYRQDWDKLPPSTYTPQSLNSAWSPLKTYLKTNGILQCPYSEMPRPGAYIYQTGPKDTVLNPEGSTVVAYCGEHVEHTANGGLEFLSGPNGRYVAGAYVIGRMDGSTARVQGHQAERWELSNGRWAGERDPGLGSFVMIRFPNEAWPPQFE